MGLYGNKWGFIVMGSAKNLYISLRETVKVKIEMPVQLKVTGIFYARIIAVKECYFYIRFVKYLINKFFVTD